MANVLGRGLDALLSSDGGDIQQDSNNGSVPPPKELHTGEKATNKTQRIDTPTERPKESVFWVETEKIKPNPEQPRTNFDEEKIRALADSIRQYGILQPIVVSKQEIDVPTGTQVEYQIIAGERRYRAASMLGLAHIPAIIRREESEKIKLELALIENLQREDLNPLEKAQAYKRLITDFKLSTREVGLRVGKSREAVANTVRLLLLPEHIQNAIAHGRITEGQARPLISLSHSIEEQRTLFQRVLSEGLVARDIEYAARQVLAKIGPALRRSKKADKVAYDVATRSFETKLADVLGTRVSVRRNREGKGKISIEFFSEEEFHTLITRMASTADTDEGNNNNPSDEGSAVTIHPPAQEPVPESESAAQPEDLSTFTI
jgi:ParB family transcriptional regulator, chromosome partitioning protein